MHLYYSTSLLAYISTGRNEVVESQYGIAAMYCVMQWNAKLTKCKYQDFVEHFFLLSKSTHAW